MYIVCLHRYGGSDLIQVVHIWSLDWEDPLEKRMAICSSIIPWRILLTEETGRLQTMESQRVRHHWVTNTFPFQHKYTCQNLSSATSHFSPLSSSSSRLLERSAQTPSFEHVQRHPFSSKEGCVKKFFRYFY